MNFQLTEEHLAVQEAAREFAQNELLPGVIERDEHQKFPAEQVKKMGELGFLGMMVDPKYGGGGMDTVSYVLAMEEISKVDASASVVMSVNNSLVCWGLERFGSEEQKEKYLKPLAAGKIIGAYKFPARGAFQDLHNDPYCFVFLWHNTAVRRIHKNICINLFAACNYTCSVSYHNEADFVYAQHQQGYQKVL